MISVISDLHFEEEASDTVPGTDGHPALVLRRNLPGDVYRSFIARMAEESAHRRVKDFHLVLAGDLFDFNRTVLWFRDDLRPYVDLSKVDGPLEAKILNILEATCAEPPVKEALEAIRLLAKGKYRDGKKDRDFPARSVKVHYMAGNHDRLSNATKKIRERVRELLGLGGKDPFPKTFVSDDPAVLIRHGHEYDRSGFAIDLSDEKRIPLELPAKGYSGPNFGDFAAIDVAVRVPYLFRRQYGDQQIVHDKILSKLYLRLLQFDDVRPQSDFLDFMVDDSDGYFTAQQAWERLIPVVKEVLDEVHDDPFFVHWVNKLGRPWSSLEIEAARALLKTGLWDNNLVREGAQKLSQVLMGSGSDGGPELFAAREEAILKGKVRLVVAGHTHAPQMSLIRTDADADRFYVNTGTWRECIPATPDRRNFGAVKSLTYVMLFKESEHPDSPGVRGSFNYWTGSSHLWKPQENRK